jgi:hypothetical protein
MKIIVVNSDNKVDLKPYTILKFLSSELNKGTLKYTSVFQVIGEPVDEPLTKNSTLNNPIVQMIDKDIKDTLSSPK